MKTSDIKKKVADKVGKGKEKVAKKWRRAYAFTLSAFADLVEALDDLKVTPDELTAVCNSFKLSYAEWRAE